MGTLRMELTERELESKRKYQRSEKGVATKKRYIASRLAKHREYHRRWHLINRYDLTPLEFDKLLESQRGRCAICGTMMKEPCVDHCHASGRVRGLLCRKCNKGIGLLGDNADTLYVASVYLTSKLLTN